MFPIVQIFVWGILTSEAGSSLILTLKNGQAVRETAAACLLGKHHGFTDGELDFIPLVSLRIGINYNTKHRMGREIKIIRNGIFLDNPANLLLK